MKRILICLLIFSSALVFSQKEASVWYFGQGAGLKFNDDGSVTSTYGQLNTSEGCSSIADANGNLLFYTDGRTVWDRNHHTMPNGSFENGTELLGDPSSTQSGIIVPKPDHPNLYYIFTVDEPHQENAAVYPKAFVGKYKEFASGTTPTNDDGRNNGLNYSEVNLSVSGSNGSVGDVVSRNNHLLTYDTDSNGEEIKYKCSEKITAVKDEVNNIYWVITQFVDKFYAFKVTATGVSATPVISTIGTNESLLGYRFNAIGYLKASPDGKKLAIAHAQNETELGLVTYSSGKVEIYDFDIATGKVSNAQTLISGVGVYGVEFSPNSEKLYATYGLDLDTEDYDLVQFDLLSAAIPNSKTIIESSKYAIKGLQLAVNNKIYVAALGKNYLSVINNPDDSGLDCNFVEVDQMLIDGTRVMFGLPPFITSFFNASFSAEDFCFGSTTKFSLSTSQNVSSTVWDFGDGSPTSTLLNPAHQYLVAGNYTVTLKATSASKSVTTSKNIVISTIPIAHSVASQAFCGTSNMAYDLTQFNSTILGSQSGNTNEVTYYLSLDDAIKRRNVLPTYYNLSLGLTTFYARVHSFSNSNCYATTSFTVNLFQNPIAHLPSAIFVCDDNLNDGKEFFDLQNTSTIVLGNQNANDFKVSYHLNQNEADLNINPLALNYQNSSNPQTLFVRVTSKINTNCFATTSFKIGVHKMALVYQPKNLALCDDAGNDGIASFDLSVQTPIILGNQLTTDFNISYHLTPNDAALGVNAINNITSFNNTINQQVIYARVENKLAPECFATTSFHLIVQPKPVLNMDDSYTICEGKSIKIVAPAGYSSYQWSNGDRNSFTTILKSGNYSLTVTKDYGNAICEVTSDFEVYNSNIATITKIDTEDWSNNQNVISIEAEGDGDYEYSIDGLQYQDSPIFTGLLSGLYTVFVNDKKGCGTATEEVFLLMYPKFFTPNGDGYNDTWQIQFSIIEPNMKLEIYNRFGKLITRFSGNENGWDGTYNGQLLPSNDYWFTVRRQNGKEYRGHFSLVR